MTAQKRQKLNARSALRLMRRYTFKLYPNRAQAEALHEQRMMMADLWNALLQQRECAAEGIYRPLLECFAPPLVVEGETREQRKERLIRERAAQRERQKAARVAGLAIPVSARGKHQDGRISQSWEITQLLLRPEWRALSTWSPRAVADNLHKAFQAFFRRAKEGAGAQSGYPRFRARRHASTISHRFRSGCTLLPHGGERSDASKKSGSARNWRVTLKGVPDPIRARGEFPRLPLDKTDAEIIWRDGCWWLSACVEMEPRRSPGAEKLTVRLDLIDEFALINSADGPTPRPAEGALALSGKSLTGEMGYTEAPEVPASPEGEGGPASYPLGEAALEAGPGTPASPESEGGIRIARSENFRIRANDLCLRSDEIKSDRDSRFKRRSWRWRQFTKQASRLTARATRIRRERLHIWTTTIVATASDLTVITPSIKEETATPRGNIRQWGASVETVSKLNRNTLNQAPAMAVQMLAYKAAEAGIRCDIVEDAAPVIAVGRELVATGKLKRRVKRAMKEAA